MRNWKAGIIIFFLLGMIFIPIPGCYFDNEEDLYPDNGCDTVNVTYSQSVAPIIQNKCFQCHSIATEVSSGSGVHFEGYIAISNYLTSSEASFLGSIRHESGFSPMPKNNPKLTPCEIKKIELWIADGFPDN